MLRNVDRHRTSLCHIFEAVLLTTIKGVIVTIMRTIVSYGASTSSVVLDNRLHLEFNSLLNDRFIAGL